MQIRPENRVIPRAFAACILAFTLAFSLLPATAAAQDEEPKRHQLRQDEVTSDRLISILKPDAEPPAQALTRSLDPPKPDCRHFREQLSRGIGLRPAADIGAIEVRFPFNSAQLTEDAKDVLNEIGSALTSADLAPCCFKLDGHTDAIGSDAYNLDLSQKRAESVAKYLEDEFQISIDRLVAEGKGEVDPIADNETNEGRSQNRRVEIINLGYGVFEQN